MQPYCTIVMYANLVIIHAIIHQRAMYMTYGYDQFWSQMQLMEHVSLFLDENNAKSCPNEKMNMSIVVG